eukprot:3410541-Prymnesium_polylepis.1
MSSDASVREPARPRKDVRSMAAKLPDRPTDDDPQAVCRRRIDVLIGCSKAQVGGVTRPADHPFATRRFHRAT